MSLTNSQLEILTRKLFQLQRPPQISVQGNRLTIGDQTIQFSSGGSAPQVINSRTAVSR